MLKITKYATAHDEAKITGAALQKNLNIDYLKSALIKFRICRYCSGGNYSVLDTFNLALQFSMDELNPQLETINQHYENASSLRQKHSENVEKIEEQIREAIPLKC